MRLMKLNVILVGCAIWLLSHPVLSETYEFAARNYSEGKYETAMTQFKELAKLGNKDAQYNVALMYLNGQGVKRNDLMGYAWMTLAASKGDINTLKVLANIDKVVDEKFKRKATDKYEQLAAVYGDATVSENYYPRDTNGYHRIRHARLKKRGDMVYPRKAIALGASGKVVLEYSVGKDGRARFQNALNDSESSLIKSSVKSNQQNVYKPASFADDSVDTYSSRFLYFFSIYGKNERGELAGYLTHLREGAETGGGAARYAYAFYARAAQSSLSERSLDKHSDYNDWMLKAAVDGYPIAKYELGASILYGENCDSDPEKGERWLLQAAKESVADGYLLLGLEYYRGIYFEQDMEKGLKYIAQAADMGLESAKIHYAMKIVESGDYNKESLSKARDYLKGIKEKKYLDKFTLFEVNAAIYSLAGDFKKALKYQKKALKKAKELKTSVERNQNNLKKIQQKEAVTELYDV